MTPQPRPNDAGFPSLGETLDFLRVVWGVEHALQKASKRMERTIGLTGPQRLVVRIVGRFPGIAIGRLASLLQVHASTATGLSKRLASRGLLRRQADPRDGRRLLLTLTEKGRALDREMGGTIESAIQHLLATTAPSQTATTRTVLESLAHILRHGTAEERRAPGGRVARVRTGPAGPRR